MNTVLYKALALVAAGLALAGCETTVDLPEPPHTPRVSLMYTLTTAPQDSSFEELYLLRQLYISSSQRVFDQRELPGRADATVELHDAAGSLVERYRPVIVRAIGGRPGGYRPVLGYRPQPGQTYTLRATLPGLETAESTLTMPLPATVEAGSYAPSLAEFPGSFRGRLTLTLRDDPATANYYLVYARVLDPQGQPGPWSPVGIDYQSQDQDISLGQFQLSDPRSSSSRDLLPFADTGLNGQRLTLNSNVRFYVQRSCGTSPDPANCPPPGFLEVHVSSITKQAYDFYLSRRRYQDSNENPFAEPAPLASNVRKGYGLFGGATDVRYRIQLR